VSIEDTKKLITPAQIRAARQLINMSQHELAELVDLSVVTIKRAESEREVPISSETVELIKETLEANGIDFIGVVGVKVKA
jgi:DNA-binding transcriptional regulator YiaG